MTFPNVVHYVDDALHSQQIRGEGSPSDEEAHPTDMFQPLRSQLKWLTPWGNKIEDKPLLLQANRKTR